MLFLLKGPGYIYVWHVQDTKDWMQGHDEKAATEQSEVGPGTPEKPGQLPWNEAKGEVSWGSPDKEQHDMHMLDEFGGDDGLDADFDDFIEVVSKKNKKGKKGSRR